MFVASIRQALVAAGLQRAESNRHSFCIGAATTASEADIPETTIKILGHWHSMVYQHYIRPPLEELAQISSKLVTTTLKPVDTPQSHP